MSADKTSESAFKQMATDLLSYSSAEMLKAGKIIEADRLPNSGNREASLFSRPSEYSRGFLVALWLFLGEVCLKNRRDDSMCPRWKVQAI